MKSVGLFDAKAHLSAVCEAVASSKEAVVITRRGKPLVRIEPIAPSDDAGSVWKARDAYDAKHGKQTTDFKVPRREKQSWKNPLA